MTIQRVCDTPPLQAAPNQDIGDSFALNSDSDSDLGSEVMLEQPPVPQNITLVQQTLNDVLIVTEQQITLNVQGTLYNIQNEPVPLGKEVLMIFDHACKIEQAQKENPEDRQLLPALIGKIKQMNGRQRNNLRVQFAPDEWRELLMSIKLNIAAS